MSLQVPVMYVHQITSQKRLNDFTDRAADRQNDRQTKDRTKFTQLTVVTVWEIKCYVQLVGCSWNCFQWVLAFCRNFLVHSIFELPSVFLSRRLQRNISWKSASWHADWNFMSNFYVSLSFMNIYINFNDYKHPVFNCSSVKYSEKSDLQNWSVPQNGCFYVRSIAT